MDDLDRMLADAAEEVERNRKKKRAVGIIDGSFIESDFNPVALIAMYDRTLCSHCSSIDIQFAGLFEERAHRRRPTELHMVRLPLLPITKLPRRRRYTEHRVAYCAQCAELETYQGE